MNDTETRSPAIPLLVVLGVVALVSALIIYVTENNDSNRFGADDPNYAPAILLLCAGAFLLLVAAIINSGRRR